MWLELGAALLAELRDIEAITNEAAQRDMVRSSWTMDARHKRRLASVRSVLDRRLQLEREYSLGSDDETSWFGVLAADIEAIATSERQRLISALRDDVHRFLGAEPSDSALTRLHDEFELLKREYLSGGEIMRDERLYAASTDPSRRMLVLRAVYDLAGGDLSVGVDTESIVARVRLSFDDARVVLLDLLNARHLTGIGAISATGAPLAVQLTYPGKIAAEQGHLGSPSPASGVTVIGSHNVQVQHQSVGSFQQIGPDVRAVAGLAQALREALPAIPLTPDQRQQVQEALGTAEQEVKQAAPDRTRLARLLSGVRDILKAVGTDALAKLLVEQIDKLLP
jgi:hypothetical protein